jgi:hypothetical protein
MYTLPMDHSHLAFVDNRMAINVDSPFGNAVKTILNEHIFENGG